MLRFDASRAARKIHLAASVCCEARNSTSKLKASNFARCFGKRSKEKSLRPASARFLAAAPIARRLSGC